MGEVPLGQEGKWRRARGLIFIEGRLSDMLQVSKEDIRKGLSTSLEIYPQAVEVSTSFTDEDLMIDIAKLVPDNGETRHLWDTFIFGPRHTRAVKEEAVRAILVVAL